MWSLDLLLAESFMRDGDAPERVLPFWSWTLPEICWTVCGRARGRVTD